MSQQELSGQHAVVVGGSQGIGFAIATAAAQAGARVTIMARDAVKLAVAKDRIPGASTALCDVADEASVEAAFSEIDRIDHLVVTAGTFGNAGPKHSFIDAPRSELQKVVDVRVWGPFNIVRGARLKLAERATITLFTGAAQWKPMPALGETASTIVGIDSFARNLAVELAPVRVNAIAPGPVRSTALERHAGPGYAGMIDHLEANLPARYVPTTDDIADVVLFAMRNAAVTGTTIHCDAGAILG